MSYLAKLLSYITIAPTWAKEALSIKLTWNGERTNKPNFHVPGDSHLYYKLVTTGKSV